MHSVTLLSVAVANVLYPLLFTLFAVVVLAVFIWLLVRTVGKSAATVNEAQEGEASAVPDMRGLLALLMAIGLVLRLVFVFAVRGYRPEYNAVVTLFDRIRTNGFDKAYYAAQGTDLLPISYYIYAFMGVWYKLFGVGADSVVTALLVKLPLVIADLVSALLLYKLAKRYLNESAALVVAGFAAVFPLFVFSSAVWGSQYGLLAMFLLLTMYFVVEKKYIAVTGCYAAALLVRKEAMYLFPLVAVFLVYNLVKASMALHATKGARFGDVLRTPALRPVFTVPVSIVGFLLLSYLVSLPLTIGSFGGGFFTFIYRIYLKPLAAFDSFGQNSLGIFNLFMRNGKALGNRFPSVVFVVLFAVIVTGIVLLVYLSKKNRANLVYLSGYVLFTLATYFVGFSELTLLTALVLLLAAFVLVRDKRMLSVFALLSLFVIVNATAVMASAGYYNNAADYYVGIGSTISPDYTGSLLLTGKAVAVTIVCSALAVLTHLYATLVLLDISMSNKRKVLPYAENATFGAAMREFLRIKSK